MYIEDFYYFYSYMPSSPLGIYISPCLNLSIFATKKGYPMPPAPVPLTQRVALMAGVALNAVQYYCSTLQLLSVQQTAVLEEGLLLVALQQTTPLH